MPEPEDPIKAGLNLLNAIGPVIGEASQDLANFKSPEEGFFFAFELMDEVLAQLLRVYKVNKEIHGSFEALKNTITTEILSKVDDTMRSMEESRGAEQRKTILERLEKIEIEEDVDLSAAKSRVEELQNKLKGDPISLVELGIKAGVL